METDANAARVLLVEDDEDFRDSLLRYLGKIGIAAEGVGSVEEMTQVVDRLDPEVIILDVNLPGENGFSALQRLRAQSPVGVIMLTARTTDDERLQGLSLGADHYLSKPVNTRELEAVIRNLRSRVRRTAEKQEAGWLFNAEDWTLTAPDGTRARLSAAEYGVVDHLLTNPGDPVSRDALFAAMGKESAGPEDRSLDVLISRLRRKFAGSGHALQILSVRNVGYVFPLPAQRKGRPSPPASA